MDGESPRCPEVNFFRARQPIGGHSSARYDIAMFLNIIFLILGILGAASILVYIVRAWSAPRLFCRVAGEQCGEPIPLVTGEGNIRIAIGTTTKRKAEVSLVSVSAPDGVEISGKDSQRVLTTDPEFPLAVEFRDARAVVRGHLQGLSASYKTQALSFALRVKAVAALREEEQGLLLDMFAPRKVRLERVVKFHVDPALKLTLQQSGLTIRPGEGLHLQGTQAQDAVWAASDKEGSKLLVRELLDDEGSGQSGLPRK